MYRGRRDRTGEKVVGEGEGEGRERRERFCFQSLKKSKCGAKHVKEGVRGLPVKILVGNVRTSGEKILP